MNKNIVLGMLASACFAASAANTWYVDDDNYNEAYTTPQDYIDHGFDGKSESKAFGTIQIAVTKASSGDTVLVLPGTYDKGVSNGAGASYGKCRVYVSKKLSIRSTGGADVTHIVGAKDGSTESGCGDEAIRCVECYYVNDVEVIGFTLRDGASKSYSTDGFAGRGGAIFTLPAGYTAWLVDCVVSNCVSYFGVSDSVGNVRTLFANNRVNSAGITRNCSNFACVFTRNVSAQYSCVNGGKSVNCTIVNNLTQHGLSGGSYYNCIVGLTHGNTEVLDGATLTDSVKTADGLLQTVGPAIDNWRVLKGSPAETRGKRANIAQISLPAGASFDLSTDFYGRKIPETDDICAGASQEVVEPKGGAIVFSGLQSGTNAKGVSVDGIISYKSGIYAYPTNYPVQWAVRPVYEPSDTVRFFGWITSKEHGGCHFGDTNDVIAMMPPPDPSVIMTNTFTFADSVKWVSPDGTDSAVAGTFENPYRTLQYSVDQTSGNRLILCKKGDYKEGYGYFESWGVTNRVWLYYASVRFIAVDGKEKTAIWGQPDASNPYPAFPGCGPAAMRIVGVAGDPNVCFQNFTLKNAYTDAANGSGGTLVGKYVGSITYANDRRPKFIDCDIDSCGAYSGLLLGADLIRCRIMNVACSLGRNSGLFSCSLANVSRGSEGTGISAYFTSARTCGSFDSSFNCIQTGGGVYAIANSAVFNGTVLDGFTNEPTGSGFTIANPHWAWKELDGAVRVGSPALTAGVLPTADNLGKNLYKYASYRLDGRLLEVGDDGTMAAGCCQVSFPPVGLLFMVR